MMEYSKIRMTVGWTIMEKVRIDSGVSNDSEIIKMMAEWTMRTNKNDNREGNDGGTDNDGRMRMMADRKSW